MKRVFLVAGKRTPFGKDITPVDLTVLSAKALLAETKVAATDLDHVIFANVIPSTTDTLYGARHTGLKLGAKISTPGYNVNRLCGSGIQAIVDAKHMIQRGEGECVLACGAENMSMIPHLLYGTRFGTRFGALKSVDMLMSTLEDDYCKIPMALTAEKLAEQFSVTRADADLYGMNSQLKADAAHKAGHLAGEIAPVELKKKTVTVDEHFRPDVDLAAMQKLRATFKEGGTVTPATASGIVDGAASVLVATAEYCEKHGLTPLAELGESSVVGVDPQIMGIGPVDAINLLLAKSGWSEKLANYPSILTLAGRAKLAGKKLTDIDLVEVNEAFAPQVLAVSKALNLPLEKLNVWGGAVALGHPLGASGIRISLTLARQLKHFGKSTGIASACIGGGQGIALMLKKVQ